MRAGIFLLSSLFYDLFLLAVEFNSCHSGDNYLTVLIVAGRIELNDVLILADLSDLALCCDRIAKEYGSCEFKLLTKIDSAGAGKLICKYCGNKTGCEDAVNDSLAEN